jgi:AcrR family transcriptional regulator
MSIRDVLDELQASRGALYYYFDSKQTLLDGVVDRFADQAMEAIDPILADPNLPALIKLERALGGIARFKAAQKELVLAILEVWNSDGNALVRERLRRLTMKRMLPRLTLVIQQGVEEGLISATDAAETARSILYLMQGYQELASEQFLGRQAGTVSFEEVLKSNRAATEAFERVLGIPSRSVTLADEATLRFWFG